MTKVAPSNSLFADSLHAGPERQCQGSRHCAGSGSSFTKPVICVGTPPRRLVIWCAVCERFICGTCAVRIRVTYKLGPDAASGWQLTCPRCAQSLGKSTEVAILTCSEHGVLGLLEEAADDSHLCALDTEPARSSTWSHEEKARQWLAGCLAGPTFPALLAQIDAAIVEAPGESVAWFFKALMCRAAGLIRAAERAASELQRRPLADPTVLSSTVAARLQCKSVAEILQLPKTQHEVLAESELTSGHTMDLGRVQEELLCSTMPDDIHARIASAQASLNGTGASPPNLRLLAFESEVADWRRKAIGMKKHMRSLFASQPTPPDNVANYLETAEFLEKLGSLFSKKQGLRILSENMQMKGGTIDPTVFIETLRSLAAPHGLVTARFKMVEEHLLRSGRAGSMEEEFLLRTVWDAEQKKFRELAATAEELHRCQEGSRLHLMNEVLRFVTLHGRDIQASFRDRDRK